MEHPLVSVCCITYNQANYIGEMIESVLGQKADFPIEFIISDDNSSDNTVEVVEQYIENHPNGNWIKFHSHSENLGMMKNFQWAINRCEGSFVAICEGDDYWIYNEKLKEQISFLIDHPDHAICFHKVKVLEGDQFVSDAEIESRYPDHADGSADLLDLLKNGNFIHTPSVVFRHQIKEFPFEMEYSTVGDYFLHVMNAELGKIKRLDQKWAVYRRGVGVYSKLDQLVMSSKIIRYQSALIAYLKEEEHKKILLDKQNKEIQRFLELAAQEDYLASSMNWSSLLAVALKKINRWKRF